MQYINEYLISVSTALFKIPYSDRIIVVIYISIIAYYIFHLIMAKLNIMARILGEIRLEQLNKPQDDVIHQIKSKRGRRTK